MAMRRTLTRTRRALMPRGRSSRKIARPWTRDEIGFMRKFYRNYETAWIARQLGRTVYSVRYKAVDLNIHKAAPSVWKGNTGQANAFRRTSSKGWNQPSRTRTTRSRRRPLTRTMRATSTRRIPRRNRTRRTTRNLNIM